jgi:ribosomal protein S18 acetylase RimI-like enzyme
MEIEIRCPNTKLEWEEYYDLRFRILREPWKQPRGSERNEGDSTGIHLACFEQGNIIGIIRLDQSDEFTGQIRFMAVESKMQGKGIGEKLMCEMEKNAFNRGDKKIILHAREVALGFYEKLGYKIIKKSHNLFEAIQHYLMEKEL